MRYQEHFGSGWRSRNQNLVSIGDFNSDHNQRSAMASENSNLLPRVHSLTSTASTLWRTGAIFAAVGMTAGAFGAHGLRNRVDAERVRSWEAASHYAIYNGLALLLISLSPRFSANRFAGPAIAVGGLIFSSSIMALVLNRDRFKFLGPVTPLGGSIMIAGYIALAF
ncbi:DUF423-domain-containing protein [Rickenella mellea]|uniref:DUF423-domain-containing protein n=1 Tax=Rickenella mellea TaxID=50990 RepID=A0A4Y7QL65_9AGAM|nr:DUF423-domain-containing protein [Rickenella mellea]